TGGGQVKFGSNTSTLAVRNTADITFDGTFTGAGALVKNGPLNSLTLAGTSDATFTGLNQIQKNVEIVTGTVAGTTEIVGGAPLAGTGTVGTIHVAGTSPANMATLRPGPLGTAAASKLTSGPATLDGFTTFEVVLNDASGTPDPNTNYSQLAAGGAVAV